MRHRHTLIHRRWLGATFILALSILSPWAPPVVATPITHEVLDDSVDPDASTAFTEILGDVGLNLDGGSLVGINGGSGSVYRTLDLTGAVIPFTGLLVIALGSTDPALASVRGFTGNVDW